jgi:hypothetical protein
MASPNKVSLGDIESSLRDIQGGVQSAKDAAAPAQPPLIVVAGIVAAVVIFLIGFRRGRRRSVVVEVKKI